MIRQFIKKVAAALGIGICRSSTLRIYEEQIERVRALEQEVERVRASEQGGESLVPSARPASTLLSLKGQNFTARYTHPTLPMDEAAGRLEECLADNESKETLRQYLYRLQVLSPGIGAEFISVDMKELYEQTELPHESLLRSLPPEQEKNQAAYGLHLLPPEEQAAILETTTGRVAVDGGAYDGDTAVMLLEDYSASAVYAFEPVSYDLLHQKAKKHPNIVPVNGGLFSRNCEMDIHIPQNLSPAATVISGKYAEATCSGLSARMFSLDDYFKSTHDEIGCIKLDVEGAEYDAIVGAEQVIVRHRPVLLISVYHTARDFWEILPLIQSWNLNYRFFLRHTLPFDTNFLDGIHIEYLLTTIPTRPTS